MSYRGFFGVESEPGGATLLLDLMLSYKESQSIRWHCHILDDLYGFYLHFGFAGDLSVNKISLHQPRIIVRNERMGVECFEKEAVSGSGLEGRFHEDLLKYRMKTPLLNPSLPKLKDIYGSCFRAGDYYQVLGRPEEISTILPRYTVLRRLVIVPAFIALRFRHHNHLVQKSVARDGESVEKIVHGAVDHFHLHKIPFNLLHFIKFVFLFHKYLQKSGLLHPTIPDDHRPKILRHCHHGPRHYTARPTRSEPHSADLLLPFVVDFGVEDSAVFVEEGEGIHRRPHPLHPHKLLQPRLLRCHRIHPYARSHKFLRQKSLQFQRVVQAEPDVVVEVVA